MLQNVDRSVQGEQCSVRGLHHTETEARRPRRAHPRAEPSSAVYVRRTCRRNRDPEVTNRRPWAI